MLSRRGRPLWMVATAMVLTSLSAALNVLNDGGPWATGLLVASLVVLALALLNPFDQREE